MGVTIEELGRFKSQLESLKTEAAKSQAHVEQLKAQKSDLLLELKKHGVENHEQLGVMISELENEVMREMQEIKVPAIPA